jgi:Mn2+/Fe2+ NRAMP family transporter
MIKGGYAGVERVSRFFLVVLGVAFVLVVVLARPEIMAVARGLFVPSLPVSVERYSLWLVLMAVASTSVGSINHLKYPAYVYEKGWRSAAQFRKQRTDLALSLLGQCSLSVLFQVAAAATLFGDRVQIRGIEDLARVFSGPLGETGRLVLGTGLWCSVLMSFIGSNTGYSLIVTDAFSRFWPPARAAWPEGRGAARRKVYRVVLTAFCVPPLYVLFTSWEPLWLGLITSALFLLLTPIMLIGLLRLTNDRELLKGMHNGLFSRVGLLTAIAVSAFLSCSGAVEWLGKATR